MKWVILSIVRVVVYIRAPGQHQKVHSNKRVILLRDLFKYLPKEAGKIDYKHEKEMDEDDEGWFVTYI